MMSLEENECKDRQIEFREKEELEYTNYSMSNQEVILLRIQEIEMLNCHRKATPSLAQVLVLGAADRRFTRQFMGLYLK